MRTIPAFVICGETILLALAALFVLELGGPGAAEAQAPDLKFDRIGPDEGFPTVTTTAVHQDEYGFYWLETWAGLFRYDGYVFKAYTHDLDNPSSISHNWISGFAIDNQGRFWVGTNGGGLNLFDRDRETFEHFRHDPADPRSLSHDEVVRVFVSSRGELWVGTIGGLNRMEFDGTRFQRFVYNEADHFGLPGNSVQAITEDADGRIWIGTGSPWLPRNRGGLSLLDPTAGTFQNFFVHPADPTDKRNYVQAILPEDDGTLLIGAWEGGFFRFYPDAGLFEPIEAPHAPPTAAYQGTHYGITSMVRDPVGNAIWMSTFGGGLHRYDLASRTWSQYRYDAKDPYSISHDKVWHAFIDDRGVMWVGTTSGLAKTATVGRLHQQPIEPRDPSVEEWVTDAYEDPDGMVWLASSAMDLVRWDRAADRYRRFRPSRDQCATNWEFSGGAVAPSAAGHLWFLNDCALFAFDRGAGRFTVATTDLATDHATADHPIRILEDRDGFVWASSEPGVVRIDPRTGSATRFSSNRFDPSALNHEDVDAILMDNEGAVWIGTADGLNRFDSKTGTFDRFLMEAASPPAIREMIAADDGGLWLATDDRGLVHFDPSDGITEEISVLDGIHSNNIMNVASDADGSLWILSETGASVFTPSTATTRLFDASDGLVELSFGRHAIATLSTGELLIGGRGRANVFRPEDHKPELARPLVLVTDLHVDGMRAVPGEGGILERPVRDTETVRLDHDQNDLIFEFVGLRTSDPVLVRYQHRLSGVDDDWVNAGNRRSARYSNLNPGEHRFEVRAAAGSGPWSDPVGLSITVRRPWWATPVAFMFYGLAIAFAVAAVIRIQTGRAVREERIRAAGRLAELRSTFFANISHEFRTPLTLIIGQIDSLRSTTSGADSKKLDMAARHSRRLLLLVNQLLDLSKLEAGHMDIRVTRQDLIPFLKNLLFSFESLAKEEGLELDFRSTEDSLFAYFEHDKLEKVFYNLLANAFKFTDDGSVRVEVSVEGDGQAEIAIIDTGIGISSDQLPFVFDRFYQVDDERRQTAGTGIGLALARELVEAHGGAVRVSSVEGEGSCFTVSIPLGRGHFTDDQIRKTTVELPAAPPPSPDLLVSSGDGFGREGADAAADRVVILIIEDNADVRSYTRHQLSGYRVVEAAEGAEGLAIARESIPDLIICDVMMPEMNGFELVRKVRKDDRTSHIPIIMLTARAGEEDRLVGLETGADDYLVKPFSAKELRARVRNLIEQRRRLRERFSTATVIRPSEVAATNVDEAFVKKVVEEIEARIGDDQFSASTLAEAVGMSPSQLNRKLKALVDQPAGRLIRSHRLQRAADLIAQNAASLAEIGYEVGFSSQAHFTTAFKKQFGVTPGDYKAESQKSEV